MWRGELRAFFQIAYFVIGLVQFFAVWDGAEHFFGVEGFFGSFVLFFVSAFFTYIPLLGSGVGVYGAVNVWDWSLIKSLVLFFWYVPIVLGYYAIAFVAERR